MNDIFYQLFNNEPDDINEFIEKNDSLFLSALSSPTSYIIFVSLIAVKAQNNVSVIWAAYLSTLQNKQLFKTYFDKIIKNIDDLYLFVNICRKSKIRKGLGRNVKRTVNTWIHNNLKESDITEYKNHLKDIVLLTHPNFNTDYEFHGIINQLMED